jgi:hypothetical protein
MDIKHIFAFFIYDFSIGGERIPCVDDKQAE